MNIGHKAAGFLTSGLLVLSLVVPVSAQTTSTEPSADETPTTTAERPELTAELKSCLVKAVGQSAFDEITAEARNPTEAELASGSPCFDRQEIIRGSGPLPDPATTLASATRECLAGIVGAENVDKFVRAQLRVDRSIYEQARKCFGARPKGGKVKRLDSELEKCLIKEMGDQAFDEIGTQVRNPTPEEIEKGRSCFDTHGAPFGPGPGPDGGPPPGYIEPPPELKACIKGILGGDFHEIRRRPTPEEEKRLQSECFSKFGPAGGPGGQPKFPPELEKCLREKVPDFELYASGARTVKPGEQPFEAGKECFQNFKGSFHFGGPGPHGDRPDPETEACVVKVLGGNFRDLKAPPSPEQEKQLRDECFKGGHGGFGGPPQLSPELESCLIEKGIDFKAGPPSPEKMRAGEECFRKHGGPQFGPGPGGPGGPGGPPPNLSEETKSCLAEKLGGAENVEKMFRGELRPENPNQFHDCFKGQGGPGGPGGGPGGPGPSLDPETEKCVKEKLGGKTFSELGRAPTEEEKTATRDCFKGQGGPGGPGGGQFGLPPEAEKCVKDKLGGKTFSDLGRPPTEEEKNSTRDCFKSQGGPGGGEQCCPAPGQPPGGKFGPPPGGSGGPGGPGFKPAGEDCGRKVMADRFEAVKSGQAQPSPEEMTKIQECIRSANPAPPPAQP